MPNNEFIKIIPLNDKGKKSNNLNDSSMFQFVRINVLDALIKPEPKKDILEYDNILKFQNLRYDEVSENIDSLDKLIEFASKLDDKTYPLTKKS